MSKPPVNAPADEQPLQLRAIFLGMLAFIYACAMIVIGIMYSAARQPCVAAVRSCTLFSGFTLIASMVLALMVVGLAIGMGSIARHVPATAPHVKLGRRVLIGLPTAYFVYCFLLGTFSN